MKRCTTPPVRSIIRTLSFVDHQARILLYLFSAYLVMLTGQKQKLEDDLLRGFQASTAYSSISLIQSCYHPNIDDGDTYLPRYSTLQLAQEPCRSSPLENRLRWSTEPFGMSICIRGNKTPLKACVQAEKWSLGPLYHLALPCVWRQWTHSVELNSECFYHAWATCCSYSSKR